MAKAKAKAQEGKAPTEGKAYRHTRTGAIRRSTSTLGYPYEEVPTTELKRVDTSTEEESG